MKPTVTFVLFTYKFGKETLKSVILPPAISQRSTTLFPSVAMCFVECVGEQPTEPHWRSGILPWPQPSALCRALRRLQAPVICNQVTLGQCEACNALSWMLVLLTPPAQRAGSGELPCLQKRKPLSSAPQPFPGAPHNLSPHTQ